MSRNLVKGTVAFALLVGATLTTTSSANAGGLFHSLFAKHHCCQPQPCCEPAPVQCCEPAPQSCCGGDAHHGHHGHHHAQAVQPCCGGEAQAAPQMGAGCVGCGGGNSVMASSGVNSQGIELAPGETLVPGSVTTGSAAGGSDNNADANKNDSANKNGDKQANANKNATASQDGDAVKSSSDNGAASDKNAPPAPTADNASDAANNASDAADKAADQAADGASDI